MHVCVCVCVSNAVATLDGLFASIFTHNKCIILYETDTSSRGCASLLSDATLSAARIDKELSNFRSIHGGSREFCTESIMFIQSPACARNAHTRRQLQQRDD